MLVQKYDVVVTNPPYNPVSNCSGQIQDYVKKHYPDSKTDFFAIFMEKADSLLKKNAYYGMINMHSWMFLSSYESLREKVLRLNTIINMAHLGARAFEEIGGEVVQTTTFVMNKTYLPSYKGTYSRLVDYNSQDSKEEAYLNKTNVHYSLSSDFSKIPGSPIAYWASKNVFNDYKNGIPLGEKYNPRQGLAAGDVGYFYRYWSEVDYSQIGFGHLNNESFQKSKARYVPVNKGGGRCNYYGNNYEVLKFDAENYRKLLQCGNHLPSRDKYFKQGITWNKISSSFFSSRYVDFGFVFTDAGMKITSDVPIYDLGALMV